VNFELLPQSKRFWSSLARRGTVLEFREQMRPRDRRAPPNEHGAEIIDLTVYRLLKEHRGSHPSTCL
jgi:hypothetical protein